MKNKYIVITGASSGIGYEAALEFARINKNIIIIARREEELLKLKNKISEINDKLDVVVIKSDLSQMENVYTVYKQVKQYDIEVWINNAGFGNFATVQKQELSKIEEMIDLNIKALTVFSTLFISDYADVENTQLINVSSTGGYSLVNEAITYCASKFYVSAFTEGLAQELKIENKKLRVKVLAPAATQTEFMKRAKDINEFNYGGQYHTATEMAGFLIILYQSDSTVGIVDLKTNEFKLAKPKFEFRKKPATKENKDNKA